MAESVTCPRCGGSGNTIATTYSSLGPGRRVRTTCPTCRGTGQASMLEPMGARQRPDAGAPEPRR
jgi:DnaJ-class molecular chaperone